MNPDGRVKLGLGRPALHGHRKALDDLAGLGTDHVAAQHPVGRRVNHEFHECPFGPAAQRMLEGSEARGVDVDGRVALARLVLGQTDCANRRVAEDCGGHIGVVGLGRPVVKQGLGHSLALGNGHGRQVQPVGAIANGKDVRHCGARVGVNRDRANVVHLHPSGFEPDIVGVRQTPGGVHDQVGFQTRAVSEGGCEPTVVFVDPGDIGLETQIDLALAHLLGQHAADIGIKATQKQLTPVQLGHLNAEAVENRGKLDRNIAPANDDDPLRQAVQIKRFVGRDGVFDAGDLGQIRPAAGRHQDVLGRIRAAVDGNRVRIDEPRPALDNLRPGVAQQVAIDAVEAFDLHVFIGDQGRPIDARLTHAPAKAGRVFKMIPKLGRIHKQLFWNTADIHARSAQVAFLNNGHPRAIGCGHAAGAYSARAGTDHKQVIVIRTHAAYLSAKMSSAFSCRIISGSRGSPSARALFVGRVRATGEQA